MFLCLLPQCECCRVASKVGERRKPKSTRTFHQVCPSSLALLCNLLHASWLRMQRPLLRNQSPVSLCWAHEGEHHIHVQALFLTIFVAT